MEMDSGQVAIVRSLHFPIVDWSPSLSIHMHGPCVDSFAYGHPSVCDGASVLLQTSSMNFLGLSRSFIALPCNVCVHGLPWQSLFVCISVSWFSLRKETPFVLLFNFGVGWLPSNAIRFQCPWMSGLRLLWINSSSFQIWIEKKWHVERRTALLGASLFGIVGYFPISCSDIITRCQIKSLCVWISVTGRHRRKSGWS